MLRDVQRLATPGAIISTIIMIVLVLSSWQEPSAEEIALISVTALGVTLLIARAVAGAITGYPGRKPLREGDVSDLKKVFDATRMQLGDIMIPAHRASAKPAISAADIRVGDADFVLPRKAKAELRRFLGKSNKRSALLASLRLRETAADGTHIMMVTGEPGAGKSVLMQELHESLAAGVEKGFHSLVPIVVLARDIRTAAVERARSKEFGIKWFLKEYYVQYQQDLKPYAEGFRALPVLIGSRWEHCDFVVIVDGLDEIADRIHYEAIQRDLSYLINADLKSLQGSTITHKYILSCRVDENLSVFDGASTIHLPGLSGKRLRAFRENLINKAGPDVRRDVSSILRSDRLVPMHVFRRNPYFLTLLLQHVEDMRRTLPSLLTGSRKIDFDYVMREYVLREALARSLTDGGTKLSQMEPRRRALDDYREVAQAVLQWLAFYSVHENVESLYAEHAVTSEMIQGFVESLKSTESDQGYWRGACCLVQICAAEGDACRMDLDDEAARGLFRIDLPWLLAVSEAAHRERKIDGPLLQQAISPELFATAAVSKDVLVSLCQKLATEYAGVEATPSSRAAVLLMARGLAAAQLLNILYVNVKDGRLWLRFRHRRLAEYYSACYLRDRWGFEGTRLRFSPWLGPVLNLVTALQADDAQALAWMVDHLETERQEIYEWRWAVGTIVEAAAFAAGGHTYESALRRFSTILVRALVGADRGARIIDPDNVVTRMTIMNALTRLSSFHEVWSSARILGPRTADSFRTFEGQLPTEWLVRGFEARVAVETLAGRGIARKYLVHIGLRGIGSPGTVLETRPTSAISSSFWIIWSMSLAAVVMGEILYLFLSWTIADSGLRLLAVRLEQALAVQWLAVGLTVSWCILRALHYFRSPTSALKFGAAPWWLLGRSFRALGHKWRSRNSVADTGADAVNLIEVWAWLKELFSLKSLRSAARGLAKLALALLKVLVGGSAIVAVIVLLAIAGEEMSTGEPESETAIAAKVAQRPVPLTPPEPLVPEEELEALRHLLASPRPSPPASGFARDVRLIFGDPITIERNELNESLTQLRTEKAQLSKFIADAEKASSARGGASHARELNSTRARLAAASAIERAAAQRFASVDSVYLTVRGRKYAAGFWVFVTLLFFGVVVVLAILSWKLYRDRRLMRQVAILNDVAGLCSFLRNSEFSETVRNRAISRLQQLEIHDPSQLRQIENVATALSGAESTTDRTISRRAAQLAVVLQNRYNHRKATTS